MSVEVREKALKELTLRALFRPANLLPAAGVAAAGIALGFWPLLLVAAGVYAALAVTTFLSVEERKAALARARGQEPAPAKLAEADASRFRTPGIRQRYEEVRAEEARIRQALAASPVPLPEVEVELAGLMDDVVALCTRAQQIVDYLESVDEVRLREQRARAEREARDAPPDLRATLGQTAEALGQQLATIEEMVRQIDRYDAQMRHVESSLGAIRSQVVRLTLQGTPDASERLLEQVGSARELVTGITRTMDEVTARPRPRPAGQGG